MFFVAEAAKLFVLATGKLVFFSVLRVEPPDFQRHCLSGVDCFHLGPKARFAIE
jgi:hypothetical protein